jgi:LmbE family N-acetylglucosaminyl deacetylase
MLLISPHLDDAALSCAARLLAGNIDEVVTVFAAIPGAQTPLSTWDRITCATSAAERVAERRREDQAAWASINQSFRHLEYVEATARMLNSERLTDDIRTVAIGHECVLLPAGIGEHPDHVLVRDAGVAALSAGVEIVLYGELPYAAFYGWPSTSPYLDVAAYWAEAVGQVEVSHYVSPPQVVKLNDAQLEAKIALVRHYSSQYPAVTGGSLELASRTGLFDWELEYHLARRP